MKPKRALVLGGGGLLGAYDAGVCSVLGRELGREYFDAVYATSVGVFAASFYLAGQPEVIENTWRYLVSGQKLFSFSKPLHGRAMMDLEYLNEIFQNKQSWLNLENLYNNPAKLVYAVTDFDEGRVKYISPRPANIFDYMRASCAWPILHKPVQIDGHRYIDGAFADSFPIQKAIDDGADEVYVVCNKYGEFEDSLVTRLGLRLVGQFYSPQIRELIKSFTNRHSRVEKLLVPSEKLKILRPKKPLPLKSMIDTDERRINQTIDIGQKDALDFLNHLSPAEEDHDHKSTIK